MKKTKTTHTNNSQHASPLRVDETTMMFTQHAVFAYPYNTDNQDDVHTNTDTTHDWEDETHDETLEVHADSKDTEHDETEDDG